MMRIALVLIAVISTATSEARTGLLRVSISDGSAKKMEVLRALPFDEDFRR